MYSRGYGSDCLPDSTIEQQVDDLLSEDAETSPVTDALEQVTDLLSGKPPEGATAEELDGDVETEDEEAAAEEAEEEIPDGVDYAAEIPMSDGSKVTLGALKDAYQDSQKQLLDLQARENALMEKYSEVNELTQYTQLPPEQQEKIKAQQQRYLEQQHELMLEAIPAFRDQAAFTTAKAGITALAAEYGITQLVGQVTDHRVVKLLHDFATLRNGIRSAKDAVKPLRSKEPKAISRSAGKMDKAALAAQQAAKTGSKGDAIRAVSALLQ